MTLTRKRLSVLIGTLAVATGAAVVAVDHEPASAADASTQADLVADVDIAVVNAEAVAEWQPYSGRLEAVERVDVRPLVPGTIVAVHFEDGQLVDKGAPLFTIDPRPYQAAVERAAAELVAAQTNAGYAEQEAVRAERLLSANAIAKRDYDEKRSAARAGIARVKAAQAALRTAQVELGYTEIVAPVAGRVSRAELTVGNVVASGSNAPVLTTLVSVSPIYASFNVDEQTYLQYLRGRTSGEIPVQLGLADETGYPRSGRISSIDNQLDTGSATIRVRARFDNADGSLLPGLYARVRMGGAKPAPTILVDEAAIGTDQAKKFVFVIDADDRVQYREVTLGNVHEGRRIVQSGLHAGERIVVNGMQRVRPNDKVRPQTAQAAPRGGVSQG